MRWDDWDVCTQPRHRYQTMAFRIQHSTLYELPKAPLKAIADSRLSVVRSHLPSGRHKNV